MSTNLTASHQSVAESNPWAFRRPGAGSKFRSRSGGERCPAVTKTPSDSRTGSSRCGYLSITRETHRPKPICLDLVRFHHGRVIFASFARTTKPEMPMPDGDAPIPWDFRTLLLMLEPVHFAGVARLRRGLPRIQEPALAKVGYFPTSITTRMAAGLWVKRPPFIWESAFNRWCGSLRELPDHAARWELPSRLKTWSGSRFRLSSILSWPWDSSKASRQEHDTLRSPGTPCCQ